MAPGITPRTTVSEASLEARSPSAAARPTCFVLSELARARCRSARCSVGVSCLGLALGLGVRARARVRARVRDRARARVSALALAQNGQLVLVKSTTGAPRMSSLIRALSGPG